MSTEIEVEYKYQSGSHWRDWRRSKRKGGQGTGEQIPVSPKVHRRTRVIVRGGIQCMFDNRDGPREKRGCENKFSMEELLRVSKVQRWSEEMNRGRLKEWDEKNNRNHENCSNKWINTPKMILSLMFSCL